MDLEHFLKWVDEKTYFFQDKEVTIKQVVSEYKIKFEELSECLTCQIENERKELGKSHHALCPECGKKL